MLTKILEVIGVVLIVAGAAGYDWRLAAIVAGVAVLVASWALDVPGGEA